MSSSSGYMIDDPPLAPPPQQVASPMEDMDVDGDDSDEEYVVDSNDCGSSKDDEKEEFVLETSVEASIQYLLLAPHPILALSVVSSHYHTLDLDAIRDSVFVVDELKPFQGWSQSSFRARLMTGTCDCGLFPSLHFPCRHELAACATASVEWGLYVHPVYR
ncbi:hypothetical protein Ahy_A07g032885 [Arachis hypogaea]|uniref:SWIM-type domain-containing protein n=1 Tax=Arachis hypogaea TaxID=3818 RepID=A0A445C814_ARAHY|nr:hypothetical protein Ahy_A07g032885 [Arachis hypogaea]